MNDHQVIPLKKLWSNDGVGNSRFVFQAEEDETLGGAGTLARNHRTSNADFDPVGQVMQVRSRKNAFSFLLLAMIAQRMRAHRHSDIAKVGDQTLFRSHPLQRRGAGIPGIPGFFTVFTAFQKRPGTP
jgi:hypothetical protein